jgi:S-adenosylmethionine:tRNA ribosyltransferase-isomerase
VHTADFDYDLPPELIAQRPAEPRDRARLMVLDRASGSITHRVFGDLPEFLKPGDALVLNETRVIPARLHARKMPGGGRIEIVLLRRLEPQVWEVIVGGKGVKPGRRLQIERGPAAEVVAALDGARRVIRFDEAVTPFLESAGEMPLPPYIHEPLGSPDEYQTVYARVEGSAAAPTAGLHFTPALLQRVANAGVVVVRLTLHVGLDTFAPVTEADPTTHTIHTEWCEVSPATAAAVNAARRGGHRVVAVGTTTVRALETAALASGSERTIAPFEGATGLFILPGFAFGVVDALVTNFHLPRSTLLMLVSSFAGRDRILHAYEIAKTLGYRFYSFGDAMLIL